MIVALPNCQMMIPPAKPSATEDVGPKPVNAAAIIAHWANQRYKFIPSNPFTPGEMALSGPVPISYFEIPFGKKVGWQVISGPDNKRLQNEMELNYTQFVIHNGAIISVVSQDFPFATP
jgi:hypothetical protein